MEANPWKRVQIPILAKTFSKFHGGTYPLGNMWLSYWLCWYSYFVGGNFFILLFSSSCCRQFFIFLFCFSLVQGSDHVVEQLFYDRIPYHKFNFICHKFKIIAYIYFDMHEFNVIFPGLLKWKLQTRGPSSQETIRTCHWRERSTWG